MSKQNYLGELSNYDIDDMLKSIPAYQGCYAADGLPKKKVAGTSYYVVNMQDKNKPGNHWMCIIKEKDKIYFIDPFGFPPNNYISSWLHSRKLPIYYNDKDLQAFNASSCGYWCCYFIINHYLGIKIPVLINSFQKGVQDDENRLEYFFSKFRMKK